MPVHSKKIQNEFELVRSYYWKNGDGETGSNGANTTYVTSKSSGGAYSYASLWANGTTIMRDGKSITSPNWFTLGFDGSSNMHGAIIIDDKLQPGEFIEITGYIFSGQNPTNTTDQLQNAWDTLELLYEWEDNITSSNTYHYLNLPTTYDGSPVSQFGSTYNSHTTTEAEFRGQGPVPIFVAGNIGTMGWQISDGRTSTKFSELLPAGDTSTSSRDGSLKKYAIIDNNSLKLKRFFKIVVYNDHATKSAYLKIAPKTDAGSGKFGLFGFQSKVYTVPDSYTGIGFTQHNADTVVAEVTPAGLNLNTNDDGIYDIRYDTSSANNNAVVPRGAVDTSSWSTLESRDYSWFCLNFGSEDAIASAAYQNSGPWVVMSLGGRRPPSHTLTKLPGDYVFIAPYDGVVESISCVTDKYYQHPTSNWFGAFGNVGNGLSFAVAKASDPGWSTVNVADQTNAELMGRFTNIAHFGPVYDAFGSTDNGIVTATDGTTAGWDTGWTGDGAFSAGDWLIVRIKIANASANAQDHIVAGSLMLKFTLPQSGEYD